MKKFLLLAGVVAAMASCAKDELVDVNLNDPNMIKFTTSYVGTTKAGIRTTANVDSVGVYAVDKDAVLTAETAPKYIIPNTRLKRSGDIWSSSKSYYWPYDTSVTNPYDFYAYYPMVGTADDTTTPAITKGVIAMPAIAQYAEDQVDILASEKVNATVKEDVVITLDHMLSKVDFRVDVISQNAANNLKVTITGLELCNVVDNHGGLDLSVPEMETVDTPTKATAYKYIDDASVNLIVTSDGTTISDNTITGKTVGTATSGHLDAVAAATGVDAIEAFLLLPQTYTTAAGDTGNYTAGTSPLPGEDGYAYPYIKLSYSIQQNGIYIAGTENNPTSSYYALPGFAATTPTGATENPANTWVAGNQYMYVLTFDEANLDPLHDVTLIKFDVEVSEYKAVIETEITNDPHVTAANLMAEAAAYANAATTASTIDAALAAAQNATNTASDAAAVAVTAANESAAAQKVVDDAGDGATDDQKNAATAAAATATDAAEYAQIALSYANAAYYMYYDNTSFGNNSETATAYQSDAKAAYDAAVAYASATTEVAAALNTLKTFLTTNCGLTIE